MAEKRESDGIDSRFDALLEHRSSKPRSTGITFITGDGPFYAVESADHLRGLMEYAGPWLDWYKFTNASLAVQRPALVQEKLAVLSENDVQAFPGGNFLEAAIHEGIEEQFLEAIREIGCPRIEVSSTILDMSAAEKAETVERAVEMGFDVHGEVGKKNPGDDTAIDGLLDEITAVLDAGADKVILESDEVTSALGQADVDEPLEVFFNIAGEVGVENLVFELPITPTYDAVEGAALFINAFGPEVNLGNATPHYINIIEQQRRGVHHTTRYDDY
jgi:phosphosulfolactate synthase